MAYDFALIRQQRNYVRGWQAAVWKAEVLAWIRQNLRHGHSLEPITTSPWFRTQPEAEQWATEWISQQLSD